MVMQHDLTKAGTEYKVGGQKGPSFMMIIDIIYIFLVSRYESLDYLWY